MTTAGVLQPAPAARSKQKFVELPGADEDEELLPDLALTIPSTIFEVHSPLPPWA